MDPPTTPATSRILTVSADPEFGKAVKAASNQRQEVICVRDVQEALECFEEQSPDVVILDDHLLGKDIHKNFEALKANKSDLPIIVVSGCRNVEDVVALMRAGAHDFLTKPCTQDHLSLMMNKALDHRALRDCVEAMKGFTTS
jgi:DNA-binding response OmpR family regulator